MSVFNIPFNPGDTNPSFPVTLEGIAFTFEFWYNSRENCYYLHVGDPSVQDGSFIISSIKLVTNKQLLRRYAGAAAQSCATQGNGFIWPAGELLALSMTSDDSIAGLGDLGSRVQLFYITSDDPIWTSGV